MGLTLTEKLERNLAFLMGARHPRIFAILSTRGFDQEILAEGWDLFSLAAGARLRFSGTRTYLLSPDEARELIAKLDSIENMWFPVVSASLLRHFPDIRAEVFHNLSQTEGSEVLVSVGTLLTRIEEMKKTEEGAKADELLIKRGFNEKLRAEIKTLIDRLKTAGESPVPEIEPSTREEQQKATAAAWAWYREWSTITRTVIKRGDMLIRLGLRRKKRAVVVEIDADSDSDEE